ncbi:hypothetical protein [Nitratifractor salsuginis]|nr:hypothetical protein [Nitratifractor salsuginis]
MKRKVLILLGSGLFWMQGCTSIVTAPIDVASSVVGAGFHMVGAAGGAVVDTVSGGKDEE